MFLKFNDQGERRIYGGSAFVEFSYCKKKCKIKFIDKIFNSKVKHWQDDSLYIFYDDINEFLKIYDKILKIENLYGENYYSKEKVKEIIKICKKKKPIDYKMFIEWLNVALEYDGFYILGI